MNLLISLLIIAVIVFLIFWVVKQVPMPEPIRTVVLVVAGLVCVIYLLGMLTGYAPVVTIR